MLTIPRSVGPRRGTPPEPDRAGGFFSRARTFSPIAAGITAPTVTRCVSPGTSSAGEGSRSRRHFLSGVAGASGSQHRRGTERKGPRAFIQIEVLTQYGLDGRLDGVRAAIAEVVVLEWGPDHLDAGLGAGLIVRNDARIGLEMRILRPERQNLDLAVGDERDAQVI